MPAQVVIVGAGFGGLAAAKELAGAPVEVTLVDQRNYHTFQPLLYQVATAGLNAADVAYAVRGIFHHQPNVAFRQATVTGADWDRRELTVAEGEPIPFDHLIVAAGATAAYFGIPGAEEHGLPLYTLADAGAVRNHVLSQFEAADRDPALVDDGALTFVIVGGGPTGVEVAGALVELFANVLRKDFGRLEVARARVVLVEMADRLLAPFHPTSQQHALEALRARGVDVRLGEAVAEVTERTVCLQSGEVIPSHTLIWAAGVRASPLAEALGFETTRGGRVVVAPDLTVPGRPDVYAVGDVAASPAAAGDGPLPQVAQVAMQGGKHAARQVKRRLGGRPRRPFRYLDKGTMATIGRHAAVAELPLRIRLRGGVAWFAWLGLHVIMLMGFRNRLSVLLNWAWNYFTWDRGPRLIFRAEE
jgi:NADH dehydrogenase